MNSAPKKAGGKRGLNSAPKKAGEKGALNSAVKKGRGEGPLKSALERCAQAVAALEMVRVTLASIKTGGLALAHAGP